MQQSIETKRFVMAVNAAFNKKIVENSRELCAKLGYSESSMSQILQRKRNAPFKLISDFAKLVKIPEQDFFSPDSTRFTDSAKIFGEKLLQSKKYDDLKVVNDTDIVIIKVPLVNKYAYAGYLSGYGDDEFLDSLPFITMTADKERKGHYVAFEVKNDSMQSDSGKTFNEGDEVIGRLIPQHAWKSKLHYRDWRFFIIVTRNDGVLLKEIIGHDVANGILKLHSLNSEYEDFDIDLKDIAQILNVVERREKMKF